MSVYKAYLETTIFNFYFADKGEQYYGPTIQYCQDVKNFFSAIEAGKYEPYTSEYVISEIKREPNEKRRLELLKLVDEYNICILPKSGEIERLAQKYITAGAIPDTFPDDALHIATTTINELDLIVSLNFQHIVKNKAIRITAEINGMEGYKNIGIFEPRELEI